jgi:rubrerythrin
MLASLAYKARANRSVRSSPENSTGSSRARAAKSLWGGVALATRAAVYQRAPRASPYNGRVDIDLEQLPIPNWGLVCPQCGYLLQGLPQHRCPECGAAFSVEDLVRPWTRLRSPRFTGHESPLPDFGLMCATCGQALAGAREHTCPHCGAPFDPEHRRPPETWFVLDARLCGQLPIPCVQALLTTEGVPNFPVTERTVGQIYGGQSIVLAGLRVPSEFYFEVLWLIRRARIDMAAARAAGEQNQWRCPQCGEENPAHFEVCWHCEQPRSSGTPAPQSPTT